MNEVSPEQRQEYARFQKLMDEYEDMKELAASATDAGLKSQLETQVKQLANEIAKISPAFVDLEMAEEAEELNKKNIENEANKREIN